MADGFNRSYFRYAVKPMRGVSTLPAVCMTRVELEKLAVHYATCAQDSRFDAGRRAWFQREAEALTERARRLRRMEARNG